MGRRIVKNYPSPRLMETIGATNQKPTEAIGELVANSFDARFKTEKLNIVVDMRNGKVAVIDDGKGMEYEILEKAVCIAEDMSNYLERGEEAKGHFGMGFKTSCSTLGRYYEIYTRPSKKIEYHVGFDINDYSTRPSGKDAWDVVIEDDAPSSDSPLGNRTHGTAFVISKLKDSNISVGAVLNYLGEAFKGHLKTGDKISVVDSAGEHLAIPAEYNYIPNSRIEINEEFGPNKKYKITGWMALDKQTHNDGLYGFNIYRKNQLVEKWDKSWFRSHLMTSRIIGEVNMDFLEATFYKQGVQQSEDWEYVKYHMTEFLKPLSSASQKVSKKGNINNTTELKKIIKDLRTDYGIDDELQDFGDDEEDNKKGKGKKEKGISDNIPIVIKEESLILDEDTEIDITYLKKEGNVGNNVPFDYIFQESAYSDEDCAELQVLLFIDHPLWKNKNDENTIRILATSDAIYRMLIEKLGYDSSEALKIRNEWINKVVGKK